MGSSRTVAISRAGRREASRERVGRPEVVEGLQARGRWCGGRADRQNMLQVYAGRVARGLEQAAHFGELELDRLELADGFAELFTRLHVADRGFVGALRNAEHLGADSDAALVQGFDRDLVAFADLTDHIFFGHLAVFE